MSSRIWCWRCTTPSGAELPDEVDHAAAIASCVSKEPRRSDYAIPDEQGDTYVAERAGPEPVWTELSTDDTVRPVYEAGPEHDEPSPTDLVRGTSPCGRLTPCRRRRSSSTATRYAPHTAGVFPGVVGATGRHASRRR
ncbi:hypothetical protein BN6_29960 [Saccharothrix espanaensis DSM 44229]|uniref:Uncharacterized protein n=1 Tax=Saccharothrix espanaensis (strain ATCC 51144 / DSM 44229 / JCM 9112 / NBRC 15066 / NRRL 15764) TaxID=1179773 RepID=K0K147_SACES|nr:hypothetical protein BN6_29960 [Saccharothrix espanaensis DSM 44229]